MKPAPHIQEPTHRLGLIITKDPAKVVNATDTLITDDQGHLVPIGWVGVAAHVNSNGDAH